MHAAGFRFGMSRGFFAPLRMTILGVVLGAVVISRAEVQIERTHMPEAHASSFAFGLPGGVNFCYDPVRGGVNYAWTGGSGSGESAFAAGGAYEYQAHLQHAQPAGHEGKFKWGGKVSSGGGKQKKGVPAPGKLKRLFFI